jgi:hypothetical protein
VSKLDSIYAPLATVLIAVVSGMFAYLAAKRKGSGTVKTSEATELWQANSEFRTMLINEARDRATENAKLRETANDLRDRLANAYDRIEYLEDEVVRLKKIVGEPID